MNALQTPPRLPLAARLVKLPWRALWLAAGLTAMITVQAFINIGVVVGVLPTTGLPLPFFSAGGTSISLLMAATGIILSVSRTARK